jgi:hypothetical protein
VSFEGRASSSDACYRSQLGVPEPPKLPKPGES